MFIHINCGRDAHIFYFSKNKTNNIAIVNLFDLYLAICWCVYAPYELWLCLFLLLYELQIYIRTYIHTHKRNWNKMMNLKFKWIRILCASTKHVVYFWKIFVMKIESHTILWVYDMCMGETNTIYHQILCILYDKL